MIPKSFSSTTTPINKTFSSLIFRTKIPHVNAICHHRSRPTNLSIFGFKRDHQFRKQTRLLPVLASRGSKDEENRAMETVLRLYKAIKNKNLKQMSEIIGHDCFCVCSFLSTFKTFKGKKQVMEFFSSLMGNLGNNFEFVVQPTMHDGMIVGVSWKIECSKTHKPIGTGFSFHMCHIYQGKLLIRNVEMFLEPLLHIEPPTLKMVGFIASIMGQMASQALLKGEKKKAVYVLCGMVAFAMLFVVVKLYRS